MILEVVDQGRLEKLAVVNDRMGKDINGRQEESWARLICGLTRSKL